MLQATGTRQRRALRGYAAALRCLFSAVSVGQGVIGVRARRSASPRKDASWPPRASLLVPTPRPWPPPGLVRQDPRAPGGPRPPRPPDRVLRLVARQPEVAGPRRGGARVPAVRTSPTTSGLEEIFEEISPIEDFSGSMSLSFRDHRFEPPKYTVEECQDKDFTYAAPLFVTAEFMNNETGEIKSQTVFMGDFPLMTDKGTFIINGTERVVVSQLVRSPGRLLRAHAGQDLRQGRLRRQDHPVARRVAGVRDRQEGHRRRPRRPQAQAAGDRAAQGARPERRARSSSASAQYESMVATLEKDHIDRARTRRSWTSTASCVRASRRRRRPARRCSTTSTSTPSATTSPRSAATRSTRSWAATLPLTQSDAHDRRHRRHDRVPRPPARRRDRLHRSRGRHRPRRDRRHRPLRQPSSAHRRRAHPEPDPHGSVPDGARRPRAHDHPGRRGDHAADADQHPAGRRLHQGVLRHQPAVAVHGPDQPARGSDPQAPPVGARPRRSVP